MNVPRRRPLEISPSGCGGLYSTIIKFMVIFEKSLWCYINPISYSMPFLYSSLVLRHIHQMIALNSTSQLPKYTKAPFSTAGDTRGRISKIVNFINVRRFAGQETESIRLLFRDYEKREL